MKQLVAGERRRLHETATSRSSLLADDSPAHWVRLMWLWMAIGCGSVGDSEQDSPAVPCDLSAAFTNPTPVAGAAHVPAATISYDERFLYFHNEVPPNQSYEIWKAERLDVTAPFPEGTRVPGAVTGVFAPSMNEAETVLYAHSGQARIIRSTRTADTDWQAFIDTGLAGADPFIGRDTLYYTSAGDIYMTSTSSGSLGARMRIDAVATGDNEYGVVASSDSLELAFSRGGVLTVAVLSTATHTFGLGVPVDVSPLRFIEPAGFSEDRCRLYITVSLGSSHTLYVLERS